MEMHWLSQVSASDAEMQAAELYKGRAFSLAKIAAKKLRADLLILSAGLGAVMSSTKIPSYDLTFSRGGLNGALDNFDIRSWWRVVTSGRFSTNVTTELEGRPFVLVCLTRAYSPIIVNELELHCSSLKFRIFGDGLDKVLSPKLKRMVAKYDERLGPAGSPGTRSDFAQRSMLHYISLREKPCFETPESDAAAIEASLSQFKRPKLHVPNRTAGDQEIISRMQDLRDRGLSRSKLLRHFRDVERIACEQARFNRLYDRSLNVKD